MAALTVEEKKKWGGVVEWVLFSISVIIFIVHPVGLTDMAVATMEAGIESWKFENIAKEIVVDVRALTLGERPAEKRGLAT